jgi:Zn-dependent membrane protease YugP
MFYFWDPSLILLLPPLALALWAQYKVKHAYAHYSQIGTRSGLTGAEVAQRILDEENIELTPNPGAYPPGSACGLERIGGQMTDHYDPKARMLRLSDAVYGGQSIAALGIAAHEVGHAIQHARLYSPLMLRNVIYPVTNIGSTLAFPLFLIGLFVPSLHVLMSIGIAFFAVAVFFTLVTLPVEFNASSRAVRALANGGYLTGEELDGAKKVLSAAALTYVAATAMAIMQLVRLIWIASMHRN